MAASETAKLIAELSLKDKLTGGVNKALGSVGKLETGLGRAGKGAGQLAGGMARAGTIVAGAAVAGFGAAAKAAIDWEDAFAGVRKTVDETDLNKAGLTFRDIELSLRKMSTTMPTTAADLAAIAESGGAMGIAGKDIVEFTRVVALLGATTNVTVDDAATALGQMQNIIGLTADEFDNFAAALVDLGNKGNSTEASILEIARRSGGAAKLVGIAKEETLGWAAAAANLGLNEELAGTAVQNFFLKTQSAITAGGADLKELAKISGKSTKQFKKDFDKNATGALTDFLEGLGGMSKDARLKAIQNIFGKGSGLTRLIVGLSDSMDTNLNPSLKAGTKAWKDNTAAQAEFDKRNATVRSGIIRLRNGLQDAAITVGEGFTPALGRATDKLATFLGQDVNRTALKKIGEDIGKAIDKIDWQEVLKGGREFVTIMRSALDFAKKMFDVINALPTEVKAAGVGLIGLNKLSGGLIGSGLGNLAGGVTEVVVKSLGSKIPILGKAFVQPVFVTNMPAGGLGGGAAGAAGGLLSGPAGIKTFAAVLGPAIAVAIGSQAVTDEVNKGLGTKFSNPFAGGIGGNIVSGLQNLAEIIKNWKPTAPPKAGPLPTDRQLDGAGFRPRPAPPTALFKPDAAEARKNADKIAAATDKTTTAVETMRGNIGTELGNVKAATIAGAAVMGALIATQTSQTLISASGTQGAVRGGASSVVSAIYANRPITNVSVSVSATTVQTTINKITRYGSTSGSSGQDSRNIDRDDG